TAKVVEMNPVAAGIGKGSVDAAGTGKLGVKLDAVADVGDDEERRATFTGRNGAGGALGLVFGLDEHLVKCEGAANPVALAAPGLTFPAGFGKRLGLVGLDSLFGFADEAAALVKIDVSVSRFAIGTGHGDPALED